MDKLKNKLVERGIDITNFEYARGLVEGLADYRNCNTDKVCKKYIFIDNSN